MASFGNISAKNQATKPALEPNWASGFDATGGTATRHGDAARQRQGAAGQQNARRLRRATWWQQGAAGQQAAQRRRRTGQMTRQSTDGGGGGAGTMGRWWGYVGGASVATMAWPWWVGHPGGCGNMVYRNTFQIIWYNITILYGNIAILYGTQLTYSQLKYTYNTVGLRRISFFSEIRSPRSVTTFFAQTPPPPHKKMPPRRSPYRLVLINFFLSQFT